MENRPRRSAKSALKGPSGTSRRSVCRGRDVMAPVPCSGTPPHLNTNDTGSAATSKNALRERTRVESLRKAYLELQAAIPSVPPNTKLSKLDVLVLATTYISHLSQLLQEDDLRATQDNNNNNTTAATVGVKTTCMDHHNHYPKMDSACRGSQRGLLHPVKKWPMRARLYPGVTASEAAMMEHTHTGLKHTRSKLTPGCAAPYPVAAHHGGAHGIHHTHTTGNSNGTSVTGLLSENGSVDLCDAATLPNGGLAGGNTCLPPSYAAHYLGGAWESEGVWGPDAVCGDFQPLTAYTGCWSSWQD